MNRFSRIMVLLFPFLLAGTEFQMDGICFHFTPPPRNRSNARIMVLFGGRNWPGDKTLRTYKFGALAEKHNLILLSPSFRDNNYWNPEQGTGKILKRAVAELRKRYGLKPHKLYLYGYSAGGQCAALFYAWMPDEVAAWGVHACGVYPMEIRASDAPALLTCGKNDAKRLAISRMFLYRYREHGGSLVWKIYPEAHELTPEALALARTWFDDLLSGKKVHSYGEDDSTRVVPPSAVNAIDIEFRNPLPSAEFRELWRR